MRGEIPASFFLRLIVILRVIACGVKDFLYLSIWQLHGISLLDKLSRCLSSKWYRGMKVGEHASVSRWGKEKR